MRRRILVFICPLLRSAPPPPLRRWVSIENNREHRRKGTKHAPPKLPPPIRQPTVEDIVPKTLVIAEKRSVAQDISKSLGGFQPFEGFFESDRYVVGWASGHLLELKEPEDLDDKYKSWKLEDLPILPDPFELKAKTKQTQLLGTLKKLLARSDVSDIVNACDAGREGELIFREIVTWAKVNKPVRRLWLQSMTPDAIREGFKQLRPSKEYDGLGDAAQCRSEADWLIGMNVTRALTRRLKMRFENGAWSVGRVQTPTLALLVERELEIARHRPEPFWRIQATFQAPDHAYEGTWFDPTFKPDPDSPRKDDWITDAAKVSAVLDAVRGKAGLARETRKPQSEAAPPLFDLTSLQREANRRMGFSARRTLSAAQGLYETHKLITYPRTDSKCLPNDYVPVVNQVVGVLASTGAPWSSAARTLQRAGLKNQGKVFNDKGVSDHFAIIPTPERAGNLSNDEAKVYDLIVRRFLAAFYPPATWTKVERITEVGGESFRSRSRYLIEPGWYEAYGKEAAEAEGSSLPPLAQGRDVADGVGVKNLTAEADAEETRPPARITEARILSLMEHAGKQVEDEELSSFLADKGLGTPATRAEIIENLVSKQYAMRSDRALRATPKGILLIDLLRRIEARVLASPELTGEMEKHLRDVEHGERARSDYMVEMTEFTKDMVVKSKGFDYNDIYSHEAPLGSCPVCKHGKVIEKMRLYSCEHNIGKDQGCPFNVWKDRNGRYIDRLTMEELLHKGETPVIEGFVTRRGDGYKAALRLTAESKVELVGDVPTGGGGEEGAETPTFEVDETPVGPCPYDPAHCQVVETPTHFQCQGRCLERKPNKKRKGPSSLPRLVCKREMTRTDAEAYFSSAAETPIIEDFVSKYGRNFKAKLVRKDTGRHGFEFPPRAPRARKGKGGEEGEGAAEAVAPKRAPAKKAAGKKNAAVKATARKATAKKSAPKKAAAKKVATKKA